MTPEDAEKLLGRNRPAEVADGLKKLENKDPRTWLLLAEAYGRMPDRIDEAVEVLDPGIASGSPEFVMAASQVAVAGDRLGHAEDWLALGLQSHPGDVNLAVELSKLLMRWGRYAQTAELLEPIAGTNPRLLNLAGYSNLQAGQREKGRAQLRQAIEEARKLGALFAPPHYHLGLDLLSDGEQAAALDEFRAATQANAKHLEAHYYQSWLAGELGLDDEAERARNTFARLYETKLRDAGAFDAVEEQPAPAGNGSRGAGDPARPNILLVSLDTLRADGLGCYGNERSTSPFLDRIAAEGVQFDRAVAPSNSTLPSHYSMLSGLSPAAHGLIPDLSKLRGYLFPNERTSMRSKGTETMLAEALHDHGYQTAAVTENGWITTAFGFDQGFDTFIADMQGSLPRTRAAAIETFDKFDKNRPWFMFVHTYTPHQPYHAPEDFRLRWADAAHRGFAWPEARVPIAEYNRFKQLLFPPSPDDAEVFRDLYDGQVAWADTLVETLWEQVQAAGLDENTVLVVTSDHGEEIFERGIFDHGDTLYEEVTWVPLIAYGAGLPQGVSIQGPVPLTDLPATLLELAGLEGKLGLGSSLMPLVAGCAEGGAGSCGSDRIAHAQAYDLEGRLLSATWRGSLKLIRRGDREELYNLAADPGEQVDLLGERDRWAPALRRAWAVGEGRAGLVAAMDSHLAEAAELRELLGVAEEEMDPETLERLKGLGYVGN
ncbi:hypothetical protein ABI59_17480 [Acidobacteria bacterium Mor1]|nr:hypothetical protein ABI59_17480 [Acidobacteria bacterium Mor1]